MKKIFVFALAILLLLCSFGCSESDPVDDGGAVNDNYIEVSEENVLVLLPDYQPNAKVTSLGGSTVKSVTVFAEEDGTVEIGAYGDVASIPHFLVSSAIHMRDGKKYQVTAGENKIDLDLDLFEYETLYIKGGAKLTCSDDGVEFSTLGSVTEDVVIADKKLAFDAEVEYHGEAKVFDSDCGNMLGINISYKTNVNDASSVPFVYEDADAFAGKKITAIRIPVKTVATTELAHSFTLYKVKNTVKSDFLNNHVTEYKINVEYSSLAGTQINYWYGADVSHLDIVLAEDETLAFGSPDDTVSFAVTKADMYPDQKFITASGETPRGCLIFDVYYQTVIDKNEKLEQIKELDRECARDATLNKLIGGKNLSILGDSVSTYDGYSNGDGADTTNDTIRDNNGEYDGTLHRVFSADLTWWQKTANDTGMTVLVNNSYSGDSVGDGGQTRCEQLHDNTGDNAGTNPDIIAILLGFNDINWANRTPETLKSGYENMLNRIADKYPDADVFLFTYYQYDFMGKVGTEEALTPYVNVIYELAEKYGCAVVDLFAESGFRYDDYGVFSDDGIHPNPEGMEVISEVFKDALLQKYNAK